MKLTQGQIKAIAISAGMKQPDLMAAIAMAESSGETTVVNSIGCVGLWQIHPIHRQAHPTWTRAWLQNPVNNAIAAKAVYASQGLQAWEAYTNGAYKKYASGVVPAVDIPGPAGGFAEGDPDYQGETSPDYAGEIKRLADSVGTVAEGIGKGAVWISNPRNWVRVAYGLAGGALVVGGLLLVVGKQPGVASAISATKRVVSKGVVK